MRHAQPVTFISLAFALALALFHSPGARAQGFSPDDEFPGPLIPGATVDFSNLGATVSPGEPLPPNTHSTVWLSLVPSHASVAIFVLGGDLPARFTVYRGASLESLEEVATGNRAGTGPYAVVFRAIPGATYHLQVGSEGLASPQGTIGIRFEQADPPPNDHFPGSPIPAVPFATVPDTTWADAGPDEPALFGATVWYSYTAPRDQRLLAAFGPADGAFPFEFRMAVYDEDTRSLPGGRALTRGPACDFHEPAILDVAAGETLWFQLGGAGFPGERGKGLFRLQEIAPGSVQDPRCALAPVANLRGGTFVDADSLFQDFYGAVLWEYDGAFQGHFELRYEPLVGERAASPLSLVASLPASLSGAYRYDFPFLVASTVRCFEVKPVLGELAGPSRRTCLTADTPRLPGTSPPEPPTRPPGPPQTGNSMSQERADAAAPLLLAAASLCVAAGALLGLAVRQPRRRL